MTSKLHDFDDGRGPVPAHRHHHGGGWVDDTAQVDPSAYVGDRASVGDDARVGVGASVGAKATAMVTPLVIHGYEYTVTICDNTICVGCQCAATDKWADGWTPQPAPRLEAAREMIIALARQHQGEAIT